MKGLMNDPLGSYLSAGSKPGNAIIRGHKCRLSIALSPIHPTIAAGPHRGAATPPAKSIHVYLLECGGLCLVISACRRERHTWYSVSARLHFLPF